MGKFQIVIHEAQEGGYWAEVPSMPGCVSEGDTLDEVRANIIDAALGCITATLKWAAAHAAVRPATPARSRPRHLNLTLTPQACS